MTSVVEVYSKRLLDEQVVSTDDIKALAEARQKALEVELASAKSTKVRPKMPAFTGLWHGYKGGPASGVPDVDTGVPASCSRRSRCR
jgi:2-oxoglutarate dehydrogenase complex dehydrogenase (E1) component-like enzyme